MTINPYYLSFSRNITSALAGNQVDMSTCMSHAVCLFQELNEKTKGLKRALGLIQEVAPDTKSVLNDKDIFYIADNPVVFTEPAPAAPQDIPQLSELTTKILSDPNLAAAHLFIEGLEKNFQDWLKTEEEGGMTNPTEAEKNVVNEYQTKLSTIKQLFGLNKREVAVADDKYTQLYALPQQFVDAINKIPKKEAPPKTKVVHFWQNMMVIYNAMISLAYPVADNINVALAETSMNIDAANRLIGLIRQFTSTLKDLLNPIWGTTSDNLTITGGQHNALQGGMVQSYLMLGGLYRLMMQNYPNDPQDPNKLPQSLKDALDKFLDTMDVFTMGYANITGNGNVTLPEFLSLQYAFLTCVAEAGTNSSASGVESYKTALNREKAYWSQRKYSNFDVTAASAALSEFANNPVGTSSNIAIFLNSNGGNSTSQFNPLFFYQCIDLMTSQSQHVDTRQSFQAVLKGQEASIAAIQKQISAWEAAAADFHAKKDSMDPAKLNYFASMNKDKETFVTTSPLQVTYTSLMLDKYLPNQEHVLKTLGVQMTFSNKAAKYMNQIIKHISSFQSADVYYSLGIYLRQMNLQALTDPVSKAESVLSKETKRCQTDLTRCIKAKQEIETILNEIKTDKELTDSQRRELLLTITTYQSQFDDLIRNLGNLRSLLVGMTLTPVEKPDEVDEAFTITVNGKPSNEWVRQLSSFENFVIEGGKNGVVPGGEQQILNSLEATQQDYTTFNQNQQLALQLESASIQQEWTLVSAAMALLNQIFAKLTRRIR
ncbi:effector from type III secretion system family protein [Chlamydia ibidis]|uniref:Effector from type III secretion system family protein n=2 Tax=Chlamydia ibidis TaxID=1405396 RepID=S7KF70_9CHLA|nr:CT620/CT621 family type III secretion system effector [Chlamydia ibidis]EPP34806.1 effector from type III secretion system family protein [Chlamydia ibidis]EQM62261.1 hypothetical protein H359_1020 [Chlamydia ibidis 10-1398/6]